jgi:integrase
MLFDDSQRAADTLTHWRTAMRMPIFPADLADNHGFKRIAKKIKRNWPSSTPLKLSAALEILSRGLGYRNFNDVVKSSKSCPLNTVAPTLAEMRDGINTSIFEYLRTECIIHLDPSALDPLVMLLPLQDLQAFRGSSPTQRTWQLETPALRTLPPFPELEHGARPLKKENEQEAGSSNPHIHRAQHSKSTRVMSQEQLASLARVIKQKEKPRDEALFALLLSGMRSTEIVEVKVDHLNSPYTSISWLPQKSRTPRERVKSIAPAGALARYIRGAGLSVGDYLFPSKNAQKAPMTARELRKIFHSWLIAAQMEGTRTSINSIRLSIAVLTAMAGTPTPWVMTGRYSPDMLRYYTRLSDEGTDS